MSVFFHEEDRPEGALGPGPVAVDTETMGLQPGRDRLCLVQIADGFGMHVPKGYIYAAMAFSALVEGLNMFARRVSMFRPSTKVEKAIAA